MIEQRSAHRASIFPLATVALLGILLQSPAPAQNGQQGLIAGGETPDLILMYTGDVIGYIDPCG